MALRREGFEALRRPCAKCTARPASPVVLQVLINGHEKLKLVFDCKPCEMHVVGKLKRNVVQQRARETKTVSMKFCSARP